MLRFACGCGPRLAPNPQAGGPGPLRPGASGEHCFCRNNAAAAAIATMPAPANIPTAAAIGRSPPMSNWNIFTAAGRARRARQMLSMDGGHLYELTITRISIGDEGGVYGPGFGDTKDRSSASD